MEIQNGPVKCVNNHFFNATVNSVCPICGGPAASRMGGYAPAEKPVMGAAPAGGMGNFPHPESPQAAAPGVAPPANSWGAPGGQADPVVGWLVCVEGPMRGVAWNLHAGYNHIGGESSDVNIQGGGPSSREKHATVAYYDKNRTYYVGPAEGRNIIELNGEPVFGSTQLSSRDIIKIGTTKLMFVPLCGEEFTWDQEKTNV